MTDLSAAEAHRIFEEAREQRERADRLEARCAALTAALTSERDLVADILEEGFVPSDLPLQWWAARLKTLDAALADERGTTEGQR